MYSLFIIVWISLSMCRCFFLFENFVFSFFHSFIVVSFMISSSLWYGLLKWIGTVVRIFISGLWMGDMIPQLNVDYDLYVLSGLFHTIASQLAALTRSIRGQWCLGTEYNMFFICTISRCLRKISRNSLLFKTFHVSKLVVIIRKGSSFPERFIKGS